MYKFFYFVFLVFFNTFLVFSATTFTYDITDFNSPNFNYYCTDLPITSSNISNITSSGTPTICNDFSLLSNDGDFRVELVSIPTTLNSFSYNPSDTEPTSLCKIDNLAFDQNTFKSSFNSNLKPFAGANYPSLVTYFSDVMDQNYHMKTFVVLQVQDLSNPGNFKYFLPDANVLRGNYTYNPSDYNVEDGGTTATQLSNSFSSWSSIRSLLGLGDSVPYVLAKPTLESYTFSEAKAELRNLCIDNNQFCSYDIGVFTVPIDGKCDFDSIGSLGLSSSEASLDEVSSQFIPNNLSISYNKNFGIMEFEIGDEFLNILDENSGFRESSGNTFERGVLEGSPVTLRNYAKSGYVINSSSCGIFETFERRGYQECTFTFNSSNRNVDVQFLPMDEDQDGVPIYIDKCVGEKGRAELMGCASVESAEAKGLVHYKEIARDGDFLTFYPKDQKLFIFSGIADKVIFFQDKSLINNGDFSEENYLNLNFFGTPYLELSGFFGNYYPSTSYFYSGDYIGTKANGYVNWIRLSAKVNYSKHSFYDQYRDLEIRKREIDGQNVTFLAPFDAPIRYGDNIILDIEDDSLYFEEQDGTLEELNLDSFSTEISIKKQGEEKIVEFNENDLTLALTDLSYFLSVEDVQDRVSSAISTMSGLEISQEVNSFSQRDSSTKRKMLTNSRITLNISNISESKNRISIYYILPKESAEDYSEISIISQPVREGVIPFVSDKDPIIGWYFEDPEDNEVIVIEVPGDSDGGTVVVTEDPVLYNSGDLVVRYREHTCAADEQLLFELDSLADSSVYTPGSDKNFKICLAHLVDDLSVGGVDSYDLFELLPNRNVSTSILGVTPITVSENTGKYWSTLIQKENPGGYSCIGSFQGTTDSYFGDCDYNEDLRLWIRLETDTYPPTISTSYPSLGNAIQLEIHVEDLESGVDWSTVKYCIDSANTCVPSTSYVENQKLFISCPGLTGCIKYIRVIASDTKGNAETYTEQLRLLDKGSSCQSDCTAKPSPNRYLAECAGLNGCFYYQYDLFGLFDSGDYVAQQCDFTVTGSWVSYNTSHDIQCPRGPFRPSIFTAEDVDITSRNCGIVRTTEYPIQINGDAMIMNIVSCIN